LATGHTNGTALIWNLPTREQLEKAGRKPLPRAAAPKLWSRFDHSTLSIVYEAIWTMAAYPDDTIPFLAKTLKPAAAPDRQALARWIADLGSDEFPKRDKAFKEIKTFGHLAIMGLRARLKEKPPLEETRRLEKLLELAQPWSAESLKTLRAIQVLELIGNKDAIAVLETLAQGAPESRVTQEARKSVVRLTGGKK
jgi:hypothetical protein